MKYRDPSIRACSGERKPLTIKRPQAEATIGTTHRVPGVDRPQLREQETIDRVLPGGLPPVAYRTPWKRAGDTGRGAREPFNSRAAKGEFYATQAYVNQWS